ncbi:MAG: replicative DNA helicase [Acidobacteriota bacterium]
MTRSAASDPFFEKGLPSNLEAERSILGAILLDNSVCNQAMELMRRDDFFLDSHRRIFDKMIVLSERGSSIDMITLAEELRRAGELEQVGNATYLSSLIDGVPRTDTIEPYVKIVKSKAILRKLITASNQIIARAFDEEDDPDVILDQAEQAIFQIAEDRVRAGFQHIGDVAQRRLEQIEQMSGRPEMITGIPSGFTDFDQMTSGMQRQDLIIIAARPSVGKTALALNMALYAAKNAHTIGIFSLEMSAEQLVSRLLCSEARVDAHRLRTGYLNREEWARLADALRRLCETKIFIDDTPGISVLEMRAKTRRLKAEHGLDLLVVDYLQLMQGRGRIESRQQEVSQISRDLKILAKELDVPVISLSQLSRATETRSDHRPQLSDLRDSGCLTGDSLVTLADTGRQVPIHDLVGKSDFAVWALNEATMKIEKAVVSNAFSTGIKPVYKMTTRLGREIRATANHKFRTFAGWKRLDELKTGERLAMPRVVPSGDKQTLSDAELALLGHLIGDGCTLPRQAIQYTTREKDLADLVATLAVEVFGGEVAPRIKFERNWYQVYLSSTRHHTHRVRSVVSEWLSELGVWGLRSYEKRIPQKVFEQPQSAIALFLRHLWATDGCIRLTKNHYPSIYYASSSQALAISVQSLLLRTGINASLYRISQNGKGRDQHQVHVSGKNELEKFADLIGAVGEYRKLSLAEIKLSVANFRANTNRDIVPQDIWQHYVLPAMKENHITTRDMMRKISTAYCGTQLYHQNVSRERAERISQAVHSEALEKLATSDVYWDEIKSIQPDGEEEVFDLTVPAHHNFIAANLFVHNSIEQDADVVCFIYRDEVYNATDENRGTAELIVSKQRNGPTGTVPLAFLKEFTRFENMWRGE